MPAAPVPVEELGPCQVDGRARFDSEPGLFEVCDVTAAVTTFEDGAGSYVAEMLLPADGPYGGSAGGRPSLRLTIPVYAGPGDYQGTVMVEILASASGGGFGGGGSESPGWTGTGAGCQATIEEQLPVAAGQIDCALERADGQQTIRVDLAYGPDFSSESAGQWLDVDFEIGGDYIASGRTRTWERIRGDVRRILVGVGGKAGRPDIIQIVPDGSPDSVVGFLDIAPDSPNIRPGATTGDPLQPLRPSFGECTVDLADGAGGSVSCPGDPGAMGGSATLDATWKQTASP
jgi:hypothetical protein